MIAKSRFIRCALFACFVTAFGSPAAFSQEKPRGTIVYADGNGFSLVRAGVVTNFIPADGLCLGYIVYPGDLLQTGSGSFVEVQLRPKGTMLKVAENTSFIFQNIGDANTETNLNLLYGRVRAKVAKISGTESFTIRSKSTTAGGSGDRFRLRLASRSCRFAIPRERGYRSRLFLRR